MKTNSMILRTFIAGSIIVGLAACNKATDPTPSQPYDQGIFVINQGNFSSNNGSISLISRTSNSVSYDIFQKENLRSLAGGVTDYTELDDKGLILVDNSTAGKDVIEVVNSHTFKSLATINSDIENPRHVVKVGTNKAYVTCWDSFNADYSYKPGYVAVIDLQQNKVTKKIPVQMGAEEIVVIGNLAYVGNIFTYKSALTVIDLSKDEVKTSIEVGSNPSSLRVDVNNKLWLTTGQTIVRINPTTNVIESQLKVTTHALKQPGNLTFSKDKSTVFYTYYYDDTADNYKTKGEVYSFNVNDATITANKILIKRVFTALGYDAQQDILYGSLVPSYTQAGYVYRYQPNGTAIDSVKAEIGPYGFFIK